jgi:hypothetical protein
MSTLTLPPDVPVKAAKGPDTPPAYAPCPTCGQMVLTGKTPEGRLVALDTSAKTYCVLWLDRASVPQLRQSAAYPVHTCLCHDPDPGDNLAQAQAILDELRRQRNR